MKVIIVEDSRLARAELKDLLSHHPNIELVAEAADVASALEAIENHKPDLLLLDIHLPDGDGFDLLEQCNWTPRVIFTTAYDQHALRAFEVNALDYLLKPITQEALGRALDKAAIPLVTTESTQEKSIKGRDDQLFIRDGEHCHFVRLGEISLINVEGNYVRVFFRNTKALLCRSLNYVEERLDPAIFFRANRQQMVNMDFVARIEPWIGDGLMLSLKDGTQVEVSRRQARELKQRLTL